MHAAKNSSTSVFSRILGAVYPPKCGLCEAWSASAICDNCRKDMPEESGGLIYLQDSGPLSYRLALFTYENRAAQAVRRLKYSRVTCLAKPMADILLEAADQYGLLNVDHVLPVPIHWTRRCARGFNQAELLARSMPSGLMTLKNFVRARATPPQVGLTAAQRAKNLEGAFAVKGDLLGKHILLIDDVVTSMTTARECAKALKSVGAKEVGILAFCGERHSQNAV